MALFNNILFFTFSILCITTFTAGVIASKLSQAQLILSHGDHIKQLPVEKVNVQFYYESFCRYCRNFDSTQFIRVVEGLHKYLVINTYPYGNAETFEINGEYRFECQHGPGECYGNKLHACALTIIQNHTKALIYNSCMMDSSRKNQGSDDEAADECGSAMDIVTDPIKSCAKSERGANLLKYYGDGSKIANLYYVPYVLVNGNESGRKFMSDVCGAFANPPPPCAEIM